MAEDYINKIIKTGDNASDIIHAICKQTISFRSDVKAEDPSAGGLTVILPKHSKKIAVLSAGGNPKISNTRAYVESMVEKLFCSAMKIDAEPIAFTNTLDMSNIDAEVVKEAALALYDVADAYELAIVNGEIAGLGDRVGASFNISGTIAAYISSSHDEGVFSKNGIKYAVFAHENKPIFMNSDGIGTKIEMAERTGNHTLTNLFAMLLDDTAKKAAEAKVLASVLEDRRDRKSVV